ncbi:hypothetical protein E4634_02370 [Mangrovimicrobium sediminis]|uniref:Uncharacterized protein n=1 Tax=Mangrovimicrobium sediminis TaxID=2562682 RepID=A0A4Z0M911_9GAMM|nr:hypothetical protein E4634_02370 [Haliea sp. SAOS-164]
MPLVIAALALLQGCVTARVDELVYNEPEAGVGNASVVILGRRHAADYETEPDFIECLGDYITDRDPGVRVIGELDFINALYPWFEPRTAPLHPQDIDRLLQQQVVAQRMRELNTGYMIWIDGNTVSSDAGGSMACAVGPGIGGCFGFGTWSNDAEYEATIWDLTGQSEVGRVNTTATGQSYMPAVIVPIPIIAPVQGTACDSLGAQLLQFLSGNY